MDADTERCWSSEFSRVAPQTLKCSGETAMVLILLLVLLCTTVFSQGTGSEYWTGKFTQSTTATGIGRNTGVFKFNWPTRSLSITYDPQNKPVWIETYVFNSSRGYPAPMDSNSLSTRSFVGSCDEGCSIALDSHAMPPLAPSLSSYSAVAAGTGCVKYTPNVAGANNLVTSFTADKAANKICTITFDDGRFFTLDTFAWSNVAIAQPANCLCDVQIDIFLLVDHSSSINDPKMVQFKSFAQTFLNSLNIAPNSINVGMAWFHWQTGLNFPMTGDRATVNTAMNNWWTNCTNADTIAYCQTNPTIPGCVGCQKSVTATATAIQGYTGPTNSGNWPTGQMSVVGARDYFYTPARGGSSRQVPKIFITLTDGAVNSYLDQRGGVAGCTFSACSPDLTAAVASLRAKHNSLFSSYALTTIAMGIGAAGSDPNLSLSPEHLKILAEGNDANWFTAVDFDALSGNLRNLLLRSCPAANDLVQQQCLAQCCGLCVCGVCKPPQSCADNNKCVKPQLATCCNQVPIDIDTSCPRPNLCVNNICNKDTPNGDATKPFGVCSSTPVDCSQFTSGCTRYNCTPTTGLCKTPDTALCPPVPCTWGDWGDWGACNVNCGNGQQTRTRNRNQTAAGGAPDCNNADGTTTRTCDAGCCPVNCVITSWTLWTTCAQCGTGTTTRWRNSTGPGTTQPSCGGRTCDQVASSNFQETKPCAECFSQNCIGANDTTAACNCATKTRAVVYRVSQPAIGPKGVPCPFADGWSFPGGAACSTAEINACPVDCIESWTLWTPCDCNYKTQNRTHTVTRIGKNNGLACSSNSNVTVFQTCTTIPAQNCPTYGPECKVDSDCADAFPCTRDLCLQKGDGLKHCDWSFPTVCPPNICYSNNTCDNSIKPQGCKRQLKAVTTACPYPSGNKCFQPACNATANNSGGLCVYTAVNCSATRSAGDDACVRYDCAPASGTCIVQNRSLCPKIDCAWSAWPDWGTVSCNVSCGGGTQTATRTIVTQPKDGGKACNGSATQTQSCNPQCCVKDCKYNSWTAFSKCATCGSGTRNKTTTITQQPACSGVNCSTAINAPAGANVTCVGSTCTWVEACPSCVLRNCTGGNVTEANCHCDPLGNDGYIITTFVVTQSAENGGTNCSFTDGFTFTNTCNVSQIAACPKPCIEEWSVWTTCNCYAFTQTRNHTISRPASNGGKSCDVATNLNQTRSCTPAQPCLNLGPVCSRAAECDDELACTIDACELEGLDGALHCNWVGVLNCTQPNICLDVYCDQTIGCRNTSRVPAEVCPPANACKIPVCNVTANNWIGQCQYQDVDCSGFKGTGEDSCQKYKCATTTGKCTVPDRSACPPINCTWGEWESWTACPVTCGNSTQTRARYVNRTAKDGGLDCVPSDANQTQNCSVNGGCCPVDCVVSQWTKWDFSKCVNCVPGNQTRNRTLISSNSCGGQCYNLTDNSLPCPACIPVDCVEVNTTTTCRCNPDGKTGNWTVKYSIEVSPVGPGKKCNFTNGTNWTLSCSQEALHLCPLPCIEKWTNFTQCDCKNFSQWQEYTIVQAPKNGGVKCAYNNSRIFNQSCVPAANQYCENLGPKCVNASGCNDGLACTIDKCVRVTPPGTFHCDWSEKRVCNDSSICTSDRCDQLLGCVYDQALFCDDSSNCTIDSCDPVKGCLHKNVTCKDADICNLGTCHPVRGCGIVQRNCTGNLSKLLNGNCTIAYCDVNYTQNKLKNPCVALDTCGFVFPIGIGLAAGVIAAIVVCAILGFAICSGGVAAAAASSSAPAENTVHMNPLYHSQGLSGVNAAA